MSTPMENRPPPPEVSPDGRFWWDGQRWLPFSGNGEGEFVEYQQVDSTLAGMTYSSLHGLAISRGYRPEVLRDADRDTLLALLDGDLRHERTGEPPPGFAEPPSSVGEGIVAVGVVTAVFIPIVGLLIGLVLVGKHRHAATIIVLSVLSFLLWLGILTS